MALDPDAIALDPDAIALEEPEAAAAADVVLLDVLLDVELQAASNSALAATIPRTALVFRRMNISLSDEAVRPDGGRLVLEILRQSRSAGLRADHVLDTR